MKIGIIGAGQIGGALIRKYSKAGHRVKMTNASGTEKLESLTLETGAIGVTLMDLVVDVDVVVIIDTGNYYPIRDGRIEDIENGMPESVWVSNQIQRPVIKAYNSILSGSLVCSGLGKGDPLRIALPVSGDNKQSKDLVSALVDDSGFESLDSGKLQDSWRQQPGSPVYCTDLNLTQLQKSLAKTRREILPERRDLGLSFIMKHDPALWMSWWKDFANHFRIIYESDLDINRRNH